MDTRVAVISIIVENSDSIETLNQLLYDARDYTKSSSGCPPATISIPASIYS